MKNGSMNVEVTVKTHKGLVTQVCELANVPNTVKALRVPSWKVGVQYLFAFHPGVQILSPRRSRTTNRSPTE
jgi:hypothetical protein